MASKSNKRDKTPSFVVELPLRVEQQQEKVLLSRFEAGRQLYNACLGEAMRRLNLVKQSRIYKEAKKLPRKDERRKALFKQARVAYNYSEYSLHSYATFIIHSWLGDHLDSNTAQKIATRAIHASEKVMLGRAKRVRFKGKNQMDSVEGKTNKSGILWREALKDKKGKRTSDLVIWMGLELQPIINKYDPVILHGLKSPVKYVRLVRRKRNGQNFFYAQLVCLGIPFQKPNNTVGDGTVGIDIGPSTIAIVGDDSARLEQFASELEFPSQQIRRLQRRMERSRRANNPDNYHPNGTIKKGKNKLWNNSNNYLKIREYIAKLERSLAGQRKSLHGQMVNSILSLGNLIKLEKLSYKAFQKLFGRSVGKRAPGMFVSTLRRKAESAGATVVEFPTHNTKLSQTCQCGRVKKKKLSERVHQCECGIEAQRDLYSAFLARFIDPETNVLQVNQALNAWCSVELRLWAAWRAATIDQPATRGILPSSFGRCPEVERVATEIEDQVSKSQDVVDASREPERGHPARQGRTV